ncbi:peroxidase-like protein [Mercenaria mercenaria]|uniref:peroxidase-like protein n=1 Tax=Mercenaria mercenaria TaxID=6596 RepID=UPI00234F608C|nr:peroxidase-like protein [Mercenaria mercenaria]
MKVFWQFVPCLIVLQSAESVPPGEDKVKAAFLKAEETTQQQIETSRLQEDTKQQFPVHCPLSHFNGLHIFGDGSTDRRVNVALLATKHLIEIEKQSAEDLNHESVREMFKRASGETCNVVTRHADDCDFNSVYREPDGSCNNREHPEWGMAGRHQERVLKNAYADGISEPRKYSIDGILLPNPRNISNVIHQNPNREEKRSRTLTLQVFFGQFLAHDITLTTDQAVVSNCCKAANDVDNCINIIIGKTPPLDLPNDIFPPSTDDPSDVFYNGYCMEIKRSSFLLCPDANSDGVPARQQKNSLTTFIDASNVYSPSKTSQLQLREIGTGFMKTEKHERLPNGKDADCTLTVPDEHCSAAGDHRVNQVPSLTDFHYVFVKEHNRIASVLKDYYPQDPEKVFQETRRIVIAIMQKFVYEEFLPSFLSPKGVSDNDILSTDSYKYEPDTNPTMFNAFGIAYRLGHSWISQKMTLSDKRFKPVLKRNTDDTFNDPAMTYEPDAFAELSYWMTGVNSPDTDRIIEEVVRSRLFIDTSVNRAFDLAAINIQRGRDHGLPAYSNYREWCGMNKLGRSWKDPGLKDHTPETIRLLRQAGYRSPLDIDLYTGGLTEEPVKGGSLGPTFECIVGRQFRRFKFGDRLWYQNEDAGFNKAQKKAIQKYTFAKLLCINYKFKEINSPNAFKSTDPRKPCSAIDADLDLSAFKPKSPSSSKIEL